LEPRYHLDPTLAATAYLEFNAGRPDLERNNAPELFAQASAFGYIGWPRKVRALISNRDVLDIGCGTGVHGIGFVVCGARSYIGVDPRIDPLRDHAKDMRTGTWQPFGWTGAEIMERLPRIRLFQGGVGELPPDERFDVAILHNVTEHLLELETVLADTCAHIRDDGELVFNHHNFFCWNGHHQQPKLVDNIDYNSSEQRRYIDWGHLDYAPPADHYFRRGLNRLRLHEVRAITARHYDITEWTLIPSKEKQGANRLTDAVRARHPELSDEDFLTQSVFCRARPKRNGTRYGAN
jgi:SAM-dependent methyltransferase